MKWWMVLHKQAKVGIASPLNLKDQLINKATDMKQTWQDMYHDLYSIGSQFANCHQKDKVTAEPLLLENPPTELQADPITIDPSLLGQHFGEDV